MIDVTILISTSSIPSHPSTYIIDQTLVSLRAHLPHAPILIMCDGMTAAQSERERIVAYAGYKDALRGRHPNTQLLEFESNVQQSGMIGRALEKVTTSLIFYLEHDWILFPNIEWDKLAGIILSGRANWIKLHAGSRINPYHEGMMMERVLWDDNVGLIKTCQWSQNPHLASTAFYRAEVAPRCAGQCDAIENIMHAHIACYHDNWDAYKLMIYNPTFGDMGRIRHIDGREGER